jgi:hypothetical protein
VTGRELPNGFVLKRGSHSSFEAGACLMEAVAWLAGEPHSTAPACASPLLTRFGICLNDYLRNNERQLLAPLIPMLIGTRASRAVDIQRAYVLANAAVREIVPIALDAVKLPDMAARLRGLAAIVDRETAAAARTEAYAVRNEAYRCRDAAVAAYTRVLYAAADANAAAWATYAAYAAAADAAAAAANADADADDAANATAFAADAAAAAARRPIIVAAIAAFARAIAITEEPQP